MKKFLLMMTMAAMLLSAAGCTNNSADTNEEASLAIACELTSEEYGIGFRKGSDLTEAVNGYIAELKEDGTLDSLAEEYQLTLASLEASEEEEATVKDVDYVKGNGKMIIGITPLLA